MGIVGLARRQAPGLVEARGVNAELLHGALSLVAGNLELVIDDIGPERPLLLIKSFILPTFNFFAAREDFSAATT